MQWRAPTVNKIHVPSIVANIVRVANCQFRTVPIALLAPFIHGPQSGVGVAIVVFGHTHPPLVTATRAANLLSVFRWWANAVAVGVAPQRAIFLLAFHAVYAQDHENGKCPSGVPHQPGAVPFSNLQR